MQPMPHILSWSQWMRAFATVSLCALPFAVGWGLYTGVTDPITTAQRFPDLPEVTEFTATKAFLAGLIGAAVLIPALFTLWQMRELFGRYMNGEVLTARCAGHISRIGIGFVVISAMNLLIPTIQALILTINNPEGARVLMVQFSSNGIGFLLAGGLLVAIGWAMTEAAHAAEENAGFV